MTVINAAFTYKSVDAVEAPCVPLPTAQHNIKYYRTVQPERTM